MGVQEAKRRKSEEARGRLERRRGRRGSVSGMGTALAALVHDLYT